MGKKHFFYIVIIIFSFAAPLLFSDEIVIGGKNNWSDIISFSGLSRKPDHGGLDALELADNEYRPGEDTEMLFHFNTGFSDSSGKYSVKQNTGVFISDTEKSRGMGAAVFSGNTEYLEIIPEESAIFAAGSGRINDFTIEFRLYPSRLSEDETIIQWRGALKTGGELISQEILCGFSERTLFWEFRNFFMTPEMAGTVIRLNSKRSLIPKRWHHHMIRYESTTGLLEYLVDGIPEDITYAGPGASESNVIYFPIVGGAKPASFIIGRGFNGYIDELRITGSRIEDLRMSRYGLESGTAVSRIFDLQNYDSRLLSLSVREKTPGITDIYYYYRISNRYFGPGDPYPEWKQLSPGELLSPEVRGRYLQVSAELLPDGTGEVSPLLSEIRLNYEKNLPPRPPAYVTAAASDGRITIRWKPVIDTDTAGYKVYYGSRPGNYFGRNADGGSSPVDAGNADSIEITGLENGKLYYFAVTSYDNAEVPHESIFSREVSKRPSAIFRDYE